MFSYSRGFYVCQPAHDDGHWKWHNSETHIEHTCVKHTADGIGIRKDDIGDPDLVQESRDQWERTAPPILSVVRSGRGTESRAQGS